MLRKKYDLTPYQEHLWSPSYFAISCGGAPIEKIKQYIENQQKPANDERTEPIPQKRQMS